MTTPPLMDIDALALRVRDYGVNTLSPVVTMMMSGVYATGALALADILRTPDERWVRLSIWIYLTLMSTTGITRQLHMNTHYPQPFLAALPLQLATGSVMASSFACLPLNSGGVDGWLYSIARPLLISPLVLLMPKLISSHLRPEYFDAASRPAIAARVATSFVQFRFAPLQILVSASFVLFVWVTRGTVGPWDAIVAAAYVLLSLSVVTVLFMEVRDFTKFVANVEAARVAELARRTRAAEQPTLPIKSP